MAPAIWRMPSSMVGPILKKLSLERRTKPDRDARCAIVIAQAVIHVAA
jgi:hypothetical protein